MQNIVTAIFNVKSEAYQAFSQMRHAPFGQDYVVAEAALIKREGDAITVDDAFDAAGVTSDDTAAGIIVGSIVGVLGGPVGVVLGAGAGALVGDSFDSVDAAGSISMLEVTAAKLYDGEVAIVALVQEDEPAFDAAFADYKATIIRRFAADVAEEVDLAREAADDMERQLRGQLRAERKAERAEKREERKAKIAAHFEGIKARFQEGKQIAHESMAPVDKGGSETLKAD
jgi:uncharacterized membrane protein